MKKILTVMPVSIGGRLTTSSISDGFKQNGFDVEIYDELKNNDFKSFLCKDYSYIVGYDFSPVKLKIDYNLNLPCIAYFSDVIQNKTSGEGYLEYYKYLKNKDIYVFYWDRILAQKENYNYMPHFVNTDIYKNFEEPKFDVSFMGRLDTDIRLNTYLELNKKIPNLTFKWYAIKKHYNDALSRCKTDIEKEIINKTYSGFIDNEKDMASAINKTKIVYNINAQGVSSLNYRTIQVLSCERLIISDKRDELDLFDNIIPIYSNIDDLTEKIQFYINNVDKYKQITKKARKIITLSHDSKTCVKKILDKILS